MPSLEFPLLQLGVMLVEGGLIGCLAVYLFRASRRHAPVEIFDPCNEFVSASKGVRLPRPPRTYRRSAAPLRRLAKRSVDIIDVAPLNAA